MSSSAAEAACKAIQVGPAAALRRNTAHQVLAACLGAHAEHLHRYVLIGYDGVSRTPVHLGLLAELRVKGNKGLVRIQSQAPAGITHVVSHCSDAAGKGVLRAEPIIDPLGGMPLLFRLLLVCFPPLVDSCYIGAQNRIGLIVRTG